MIDEIKPIREKQNQLLKNDAYLEEIITKGDKIANDVANDTLIKVKKAVGLL